MRVGIVGYGSVAALHADLLAMDAGTRLTVWGPDAAKASAFAAGRPACDVAPTLDALIEASDGVVIASPSPSHQAQAEAVLRAGRAVLIEIPACDSAAGGERLAALACERGALLRGVHASRFLAPNALLGAALDAGRIGSVERVLYRRTVVPRNRTWTDDALRHHAQHPIDLLLDWLGDARPLTCVTWWRDGARVAVEAELAFGSSTLARIAVRYGADAAESSMRVEGTRGTLETDGFTWLSQDGAPPTEVWDADTTYAASIERCDALFVEAIGGRPVGPSWDETLRLARVADALEAVERRRDG